MSTHTSIEDWHDWYEEDFEVPPGLNVGEDDPWMDLHAQKEEDVSGTPSLEGSKGNDGDEAEAQISPIVPSDDRELQDEPAEAVYSDDPFQPSNGKALSGEPPERYWDEPEPLEEYDGELSELMYALDDDVTGISRKLRIGEFVASMNHATNAHRLRITQLLENFTNARLRRWLPWLRNKEWTGHTLILFLEFRNVWDSSTEWWEADYWDARMGSWIPVFNRATLSLDASYELIHQRLNCSPREVISDNWLEEWNDLGLYMQGFDSFASFALFRAEYNDDGDWRDELGLPADDDYGGFA